MNVLFWIAVIVDAIILLIVLILGMGSTGGGNGGREMAIIFGLVLPAVVVVSGIILYRRADAATTRLIAVVIVAAPGLLLAATRGRSVFIDWQVRRNATGSGYFSGGDLAAAGSAVVQGNAAGLRQIGPSLAVNSPGAGGVTLMNLAVQQGHLATASPEERARRLDVVQALLDRGADPEPGLAEATRVADVGFLRVLLDAGADVNFADHRGPFVFEWLAVTPISHFTLLCDRGLDLNARNTLGEPLIVAAARADRWDLVELLIARGADLHRTDTQGERLLDVVTSRLHSTTTRSDEQRAAIQRVHALVSP